MSARSLALDWSVDGAVGGTFLVLVALAALVYLSAAARGARNDRRHRRWPRRRTACFVAGLAILVIDLYSGIGTEADVRLSAHMLEHMILWIVVAPLLAAGAPVRLALYALPRDGRQALARYLHLPVLRALTSPVGSVALFCAIVLITHAKAVYGLALGNDYVHAGEHALYLLSALLLWAPLLGVDPLPHRTGPRVQLACVLGCMLPMALIAVWLGTASDAVYAHYVGALGADAVRDQRLAAAIMMLGCLPAFASPLLGRAPKTISALAPRSRIAASHVDAKAILVDQIST
jgi:cytochrome c oxidase assembly factor CtaG